MSQSSAAWVTPPQFKLANLSPAIYRAFLSKAKQAGYAFVRFGESDRVPSQPYILLRHDIDLSPRYAAEMAKLERDAGIASTYFVLIDGQFYNILRPDNIRHLRTIHDLGFEIGLHFSVTQSTKASVEDEIEYQVRTLESIIEAPVRSISQHDPVNTGAYRPVSSRYVDAYAAFDRLGLLYVSDSGKMWRQYTLDTALDTGRNLCLLAHPISWICEKYDLLSVIHDIKEEEVTALTNRFSTFAHNHITYYQKRMAEEE
jgi:hypothetical protein